MLEDSRIYGELALVSGNGNPELAEEISQAIGQPLLQRSITVFPNDNTFVQFHETVRSRDVFVIQPTCRPVNNNLMELLILIHTARRASAGRITAVVPFFAYARSDKKDMPRVPITAKLVADLIQTAGADRFMCVDLHAGQIQGFFDIPGDELTALPFLARHIQNMHIPNLTVLSGDLGFAKKARNVAEMLHAPVAFAEKRRVGTDTETLNIIGDVRGRNVLIVDDEVDGASTMAGAAAELRTQGAAEVYACFVHSTFSAGAVERMQQAGFTKIVTTNTEPLTAEQRLALPNLEIIHLGPWLGCVIEAVHRGQSVGETLHDYYEHCGEQ
ncbi:MAG: ribose-phosphate diphosphokinase [Anaerolineales bacterium]